jgi:hypothetical protein
MPNKKSTPARAKKTPLPAPEPVSPDLVLTKAQQYYIKGNMEGSTPVQIASDLGLTVEIVKAYIATVERDSRTSRTSKLMQRPSKGVVAMTEAASMAADDIRNKNLITQAEINRASASGNFELAAELVKRREEQTVTQKTMQKARYGHCWHFIRDPNENDSM